MKPIIPINRSYGWLGLCLFIALAACQKTPQREQAPEKVEQAPKPAAESVKESKTSGAIYIAVDETFKPLAETLIAVFEATHPQAHINPLYLPGEEAITAMLNSDSVRLVMAARQLNKEEKKHLMEQGTSDKVEKIADDAVVLIAHKDNDYASLSQQNLRDLLTGKLTSWKQINPLASQGDIQLIFDHVHSSTIQFLLDSVLRDRASFKPAKAYEVKSNIAVIEEVKKRKDALGVIGMSWISDQDSQEAQLFRKDVRICKLENMPDCPFNKTYGRYMQPFQGPVKAGCYFLTRPAYIIHRESRSGLGTSFTWFAVSADTGQRIILKAGMVPARGVTRIVAFPSKK